MNNKPREIRWSIYCLFTLIALSIISLIITLAQNDSISAALVQGMRNTIASTTPSLSIEGLESLARQILFRRNVFHVSMIICWSILTFLVYKRRYWGRMLLILFILISFMGSIYGFFTADNLVQQLIAILGWAARIILLWLLLVPLPARSYFKTKPIIDGEPA
jgi:hypothetical protein